MLGSAALGTETRFRPAYLRHPMSDDSKKRPPLPPRVPRRARRLGGARGGPRRKPQSTKSAEAKRRRAAVVVGAGAFGGWTALELPAAGPQVTLVDAWGPGNSRASSGGETRVIRGVYGADRIYTEMAARAFQLWHENEARWKTKLYRRTGALWMIADEGAYVRDPRCRSCKEQRLRRTRS